ncbi:hypothetical protein BDZ97DRAFT_1923874 [Flammula alnicola]|nr:hypothetical protein BDZ97DRAFT_1923874 [Flammula alnicola]
MASSSISGVAKLNRDILWYIFCMNAELADTGAGTGPSCKALTTTVWTSHVCSLWREILLDSASIWGRIIDLNLLAQPDDEWRNEVLKRTGSAPLYVTGRILVSVNEGNALRFFFSVLLPADWTRIRRFDVAITELAATSINEALWGGIQNAMPYLESFSLEISSFIPAVLASPTSVLFSNHAPALREFQLSCRNININLNTPWFHQLRTLTLEGELNVYDLLKGFAKMPLLEDLTIQDLGFDGAELDDYLPRIPFITLPQLRKLRLDVTLPVAAFFLGNTTAAPGCATVELNVDVDSFLFDFTLPRDMLDTFRNGLMAYVQSYFLNGTKNTGAHHQGLRIELADNRFYLRHDLLGEAAQPHFESIYSEYQDAFVVDIGGDRRPESIGTSLVYHLLLDVISQCQFPSSIKTVNIDIGIPKMSSSGIVDLKRLLLSLSSIEEMHTTPTFLGVMLEVLDIHSLDSEENSTANIPLPSLHTIRLEPLKYEDLDTIERFLSWRLQLCPPVSVENVDEIAVLVYRDTPKEEEENLEWSTYKDYTYMGC